MKKWDDIYVDGAWRAAAGDTVFTMLNSATEEVIATARAGEAADVDAAVAAARAALPAWSTTSPDYRAALLKALSAQLSGRLEELTRDIVAQVGMPIETASFFQTGAAVAIVDSYVDILSSYEFEQRVGNSLVVREPVGVVGCITPWNYPLVQTVFKVAPALAAGCTVVVKPSEIAPLAALVLAEAADAAGLPAGVLNVVTGGAEVGDALVGHPDVNMVSFTGSTNTGKQVAARAASTLKRVALELGGKSANVILDDADLETAVGTGVHNAFLNSGQTCFSWTRMLVPEELYGTAVDIAVAVAESLRLGDPLDAHTTLGPVVSSVQRERVRDYIRIGAAEGARIATGGAEQPADLDRGFFVRPTVFADVDNRMRIAQEEIFGPVLSVISYRGDDEAVALANDSRYGLHGAVWSADHDRAMGVARRLQTGMVDINGGELNILAPFGGVKQSGYGREWGVYGLQEFLSYKGVQT